MNEIDEKLLDAWIARLRSGQHRQAKQALCAEVPDSIEVGYCCLGVLDLERGVDLLDRMYNTSEDMETEMPVSGSNGLSTATRHVLAACNDEGWNFHMIADLLERNRETLVACGCLDPAKLTDPALKTALKTWQDQQASLKECD